MPLFAISWSVGLLAFSGLLYLSVLMATVAVVILENRQPVKTIAWVLVLTTIPIGGLIFFYFFGQNIRKKRLISRRAVGLLAQKAIWAHDKQTPHELPETYQPLIRLFERMDVAPTFADNELDVYTHGKDFFAQLLKDIAAAQNHIHLETYILDADTVGSRVAEALAAKAKEGVEVRLIYDDVGCWHTPNAFFNKMIAAGVRVYPFMPVRFPSLTHKINYRNHRKVVVIDGLTGYIGGMNIADRYAEEAEGRYWRDTHLRLRGGAVHGLQRIFLTDWYFISNSLINDARYYPLTYSPDNDCLVQMVTSSPADHWEEMMLGLTWAIHNARRYVYIQTPYFMPTEPVLKALQTVALAGVDVRLLVPTKPDGFWLRFANEAYYNDVLQAGIKLYTYTPGFLHSKVIIVDDALCSIGSMNMDFRSFENNFEANAFIYHAPTAIRLRQCFEQDIAQSVQISLAHWRQRPLRQRIQQSLTRLLSPLF